MIQHLVVQMHAAVVGHADHLATRIRVGDDWCTHIFRGLGERIDGTAQELLSRGIRPGDRIDLFANNCPEWSEIDFGAATVGAIPVPIYTTSTPERIRHTAVDSGLRILFVSDRSECERTLEVVSDLSELKHVVILEP